MRCYDGDEGFIDEDYNGRYEEDDIEEIVDEEDSDEGFWDEPKKPTRNFVSKDVTKKHNPPKELPDGWMWHQGIQVQKDQVHFTEDQINELITMHIGLAYGVTDKIISKGDTKGNYFNQEIFSAAQYGMYKALLSWDIQKNLNGSAKITTYMTTCAQNMVTDALRKEGAYGNRNTTKSRPVSRNLVSLEADNSRTYEGCHNLAEKIASTMSGSDIDKEFDRVHGARFILNEAIDYALNPLQGSLVRLSYGVPAINDMTIEDDKELSSSKLATMFNISRKKVEAIVKEALGILQEVLENRYSIFCPQDAYNVCDFTPLEDELGENCDDGLDDEGLDEDNPASSVR